MPAGDPGTGVGVGDGAGVGELEGVGPADGVGVGLGFAPPPLDATTEVPTNAPCPTEQHESEVKLRF